MLPRQNNLNSKKLNSSRNNPNKFDHGNKKLISRMEDPHSANFSKYGNRNNPSKVGWDNAHDKKGQNRLKSVNSRSIGKGSMEKRKKSMDKKTSRNNFLGKNKSSKSSLSQNKNKGKKGRNQSQNMKKKDSSGNSLAFKRLTTNKNHFEGKNKRPNKSSQKNLRKKFMGDRKNNHLEVNQREEMKPHSPNNPTPIQSISQYNEHMYHQENPNPNNRNQYPYPNPNDRREDYHNKNDHIEIEGRNEQPEMSSDMMPRHFNMHPQREAHNLKKHQMGAEDMRRFKQSLNESNDQQPDVFVMGRANPVNENARDHKGKQLINLRKKESGKSFVIDVNKSDKEKFNMLIMHKQKDIDEKLEDFKDNLEERVDQQNLFNEHENLISAILLEEEELLDFHKKNLDENIKDIEIESQLLNDVDAPGSDIDKYIGSLKKLLGRKMNSIIELNDMLFSFDNNLKKEKLLNERIHEIMKETEANGGTTGDLSAQATGETNFPSWNNYINDESGRNMNPDYSRGNDTIQEESEYRLQEESPHMQKREMKVNFGDSGGDYVINNFSQSNQLERDMDHEGSSPRRQNLPENLYKHYPREGEEFKQHPQPENAWSNRNRNRDNHPRQGNYRQEY